jgi:hypothetical protein
VFDVLHDRELQRHSRWKLNHGDLSLVAVKVFFLLQSHFAAVASMFTRFIGFLSDMKEVLVFAKRVVQVMNFHLNLERI